MIRWCCRSLVPIAAFLYCNPELATLTQIYLLSRCDLKLLPLLSRRSCNYVDKNNTERNLIVEWVKFFQRMSTSRNEIVDIFLHFRHLIVSKINKPNIKLKFSFPVGRLIAADRVYQNKMARVPRVLKTKSVFAR